jgi:putative transposase
VAQRKKMTKIAAFFQVTRQRIHQILIKFKKTGEIPFLKKPGREPKEIDGETETIIIETHKKYNLGAVHLERKRSMEGISHITQFTKFF